MEILGLVNVPFWCLLVSITVLLLYVYGTWNFSLWTSQGVAGPKPFPLLGNSKEIFAKTQFRVFGEYQQKYGRIFGIFLGVRPVLVVTDLSMIKEVLVKNFTNFTDRNFIKGARPPLVDKGLFFAGGTVWKRIRNMMTPAFTTLKLKLMSHYINRCSNLLSESLAQLVQAGKIIGVKDLFGSYTMDVIAGTAFGLETNSQTEEGEPFVMHSKELFNTLTRRTRLLTLFYITNAFPFLATIMAKMGLSFTIFRNEHAKFFLNAVSQMIEDRKHQCAHKTQKRTDLLQMLVEAEASPENISDTSETSDDTKSHRRLTKDEIIGQGFIVFIAGYETTATTLQFLTFNLVFHPQVQETIYEEIVKDLGDEEPTYENVANLKYLDAAIRETLRLFPPLPVIDRNARNSTTINGITIPAGCGVLVPIYAILHDPQLFHDPETFLPERYLEENLGDTDPMLLELAFGYGPRQCIGMRLALLELKFAAVRILRKFRLVKCPDTPEKITFEKAFAMAVPDKPIKVKAEFRDQ